MPKPRNARPGELIRVEQGEYSDYGVLGFFVVLREFDPQVLYDEVRASNEYGDVLPRYIAAGYLLEVDHSTMHLGRNGLDGLKWSPR